MSTLSLTTRTSVIRLTPPAEVATALVLRPQARPTIKLSRVGIPGPPGEPGAPGAPGQDGQAGLPEVLDGGNF